MAVSVAVNGGGDAVVYQTSSGVFFDLLDSSLSPAQLDQTVNSTASSWVDATTRTDGGFTVEWLANGAIMAEDFSATGASLGAAHAWTGPAPASAPLAFTSGADGATAVLPTGGSVTGSVQTVQNQYQLQIQQYDASGHANAPAFTLTSQPVSLFGGPNIAPLADGGYVAEYAVDGNYSASLYLERFSSTGSPLGQIAVAHYGGLVSLQPSDYAIAGLADGGFVASWSIANGTAGASSASEAYVEEFSASGTGLGVVDLGHASSKAPVVDALGDGHYVVSWTADTGAAEHKAFTEAGASLGKLDPAAPAGQTSQVGQAETSVQHALSTASGATGSALHGLGAVLAGALGASTHASAQTSPHAPLSSDAPASLWQDHHTALLQSLHQPHGAASLVWLA